MITDHFLIVQSHGMQILKISDIQWIYTQIFSKKKAVLLVYDAITSTRFATGKSTLKEQHIQIMEELYKRNSNIVLGYSFEKEQNYLNN